MLEQRYWNQTERDDYIIQLKSFTIYLTKQTCQRVINLRVLVIFVSLPQRAKTHNRDLFIPELQNASSWEQNKSSLNSPTAEVVFICQFRSAVHRWLMAFYLNTFSVVFATLKKSPGQSDPPPQ